MNTPFMGLICEDVGVLFGIERALMNGLTAEDAEPITAKAVQTWYHRHRKGGSRKRRLRNPDSDPNAAAYEANPFPEPGKPNARTLMWGPMTETETMEDVKERLRHWYRNRPGRGAGGGRHALETAPTPTGDSA